MLGRSFSYELLRAVTPLDEHGLNQALAKLTEAELLYQRGVSPNAMYIFKHALIQETAYGSMLKSRRQQLHQRITQALVAQFPETVETQPELLAHHYTEAGLGDQAIEYWQRAGQRCTQRSANLEAINHLTKGLRLLETRAESAERNRREVTLLTALGVPLQATKGFASTDVERVYVRARELCQQIGDTPDLFPVLWGLWWFYEVRGEVRTAREMAEQVFALAQRERDPALLLQGHRAMGQTLLWFGELSEARAHLEQWKTLYRQPEHHSLAFRYGMDPGVALGAFESWALWFLGYPEQSLCTMQAALALAEELSHPFSLAFARDHIAWLHSYRRENRLTEERAEADMALSMDQGFPFFFAHGTGLHGWALAVQGRIAEGIAEIHRSLTVLRETGAELTRIYLLALLANAYEMGGRIEEGLSALTEALAISDKNGLRSCCWAAELHRLKGKLLLRQATGDAQEAEACFLRALDVARSQSGKALELRAAVALGRLWQQHGKREDAHRMLAEIYGWFSEGFDTPDLKDARALLDELTTQ